MTEERVTPEGAPAAAIEGCASSHRRLLGAITALDDATARRPSRLPGWTVGHVLTHIARNADGLGNILEGASRDEVRDQYPGGNEQRSRDIEAGAGRPAAVLVDDVRQSAARFEATEAALSPRQWAVGRGRSGGGERLAIEVPFRRWREVEVHHVDLGLGYEPADWPDSFVEVELSATIAELQERLSPGQTLELRATDADREETWRVSAYGVDGSEGHSPVVVSARRSELVAWLVGRQVGAGWPAIAPWQREHR